MSGKHTKSPQNSSSVATQSQTGGVQKAVMVQEVSFSGPLPHPSLLAKYNDVIPNGADRIMAMAERQSAHRESLEARVVNGNIASQTRGSYFAFIIVVLTLLGGFFLIYEGKNILGLATIIAAIGGVASVFFYSKHEQKKERAQKASTMQRSKRQK